MEVLKKNQIVVWVVVTFINGLSTAITSDHVNLQFYHLDMHDILAPAAGPVPAAGAKFSSISRQYCSFYGTLNDFKP